MNLARFTRLTVEIIPPARSPRESTPEARSVSRRSELRHRHSARFSDRDRIGLIGFSLGAATAMTFIASQPPGTVKALGNFSGFLTDRIRHEVSRFPPTIMLHNKNDQLVPVVNSRDLDRLIPAAIAHRCVEYDEQWQEVNHAFEPGGLADTSSRSETTKWFVKHLPPDGEIGWVLPRPTAAKSSITPIRN